MNKQYTIVLGKCYPRLDEEDWPTEENTACVYELHSVLDLAYQMSKIIDADICPAPWWWIFDGNITEDNLVLSGAIDPDDMDILDELGYLD